MPPKKSIPTALPENPTAQKPVSKNLAPKSPQAENPKAKKLVAENPKTKKPAAKKPVPQDHTHTTPVPEKLKTKKQDRPPELVGKSICKVDIREQLFIDAYLADPKLNSTKAAITAGYSPNIARSYATMLLRKDSVILELGRRRAKLAEASGITAKMIVDELAKLGFSNFGDYMKVDEKGDPTLNFKDLTRDQTAALTEVTIDTVHMGEVQTKKVKFKLADKRAALVDIGKHIGMFIDRREITGKDGAPLLSGLGHFYGETEDITGDE